MKKTLTIIMTLVLAVSLVPATTFSANIGDVVGHTLHTDIIAMIDGYDINCYNMNGYTYVVAENLRQFGFFVGWSPQKRTLEIYKSNNAPITSRTITAPVDEKLLGKPCHNVLYTDIVTTMNGEVVPSYNIGGQTIIPFNELYRFGYVEYNDAERRLRLKLYDGEKKPVESKILSGDLSDFSGVYINAYGEKSDLRHDGTLGYGFVEDDGSMHIGVASDFSKERGGSFTWGVTYTAYYEGEEYGEGFGIWLYPPNVEVYVYNNTRIPTDTSVPRLYVGQDFCSNAEMPYQIYYPAGYIPKK